MRLGAGPGRRRLAAAWCFVYILYILYIFVYICIYFDIFLYILIYLVLNWYQFGIKLIFNLVFEFELVLNWH